MKNIYSMLSCIVGGLFVVSCSDSQDNEIIDNTPKEEYFIVSAPTTSLTRAKIVGDLLDSDPDKSSWSVAWEQTDKIYAWDLNTLSRSTFKWKEARSKTNSAYFVLESGSFDPNAEKWILMYPDMPNTSCVKYTENGEDHYKIHTQIPSYQKAVDNSFDPNAPIWVGSTEAEGTRDVELTAACMFFRITTTRPCHSVTITACPTTMQNHGDATWYCSGDVILNSKSGGTLINYTGTENPCEFVKLTANGTADTSATFEPGTYLIAAACSTRFPGLKVVVDYGGDDKPTVENNKIFQFQVSYIYNLGVANSTLGE